MQHNDDIARDRAHMPAGTARFLNLRSLASAHRHLAQVLRPGMAVLDVGCGTGAITRGIAEAVAPQGRVVGLDINGELIEQARRAHQDVPGLSFEVGDIYKLAHESAFDIVTAARMLQWLAFPQEAIRLMAGAAKPGGRLVVLDYDHTRLSWQPAPPRSVRAFYDAFLRWRAEAGMDNSIAEHLAIMFEQVGLDQIQVVPQHELTQRSDTDFEQRIGIWADVAATRGHQMVRDGAISEDDRRLAEDEYRTWMKDQAQSQSMYLLAVEGTRAP